MSISIALICEGVTDPPTVCPLADRMILAAVDWLRELADEIDTHRHYRGFRPTDPFMTWFEIDDLSRAHGVKEFGHFDGLPLHRDGRNVRRALALLTLHAPEEVPVDAIVFFRDGGREYEDRRDAILRVRDRTPLRIPVAVGVANRMRECWVISGFEPAEESEEGRLEAEHDRVGFDPRFRAHDLTDTNDADDRSPKRVLRSLTGDNPERERECVGQTSLLLLRSRGERTGLNEFLDDLATRLVEAFR